MNKNNIDANKQILEEGLDDKWTRDDVTITLKDILDITTDIPVRNIQLEKLKNVVLNWKGNPKEIEKIEKSDLQYPVLIIVDGNNKIKYILDGNHRVQKAIKYNLQYVACKLIKLNKLPQHFQFVLG
mgnify:CR=1 FL=1|jgi:disulfide oxidoreductase YuzD